jgi:hypothetical protein
MQSCDFFFLLILTNVQALNCVLVVHLWPCRPASRAVYMHVGSNARHMLETIPGFGAKKPLIATHVHLNLRT